MEGKGKEMALAHIKTTVRWAPVNWRSM